MAQGYLDVPAGWRNAEPFYAPAVDRVWTALRDPRTPERIQRYYTQTQQYAGSTFTSLGAQSPNELTTADLVAASLLDVRVPPTTVRAVLDDATVRQTVAGLLEQLPVEARLQDVDPQMLAVMDQLYVTLRDLVPTTRERYETHWATAAKICSAKRPNLFPVRDEVVCRYLKLWPSRYQVDWQVFFHIISQDDVRAQITRLVKRAAESTDVDVRSTDHTLRHLDVILYMHAPHHFDL